MDPVRVYLRYFPATKAETDVKEFFMGHGNILDIDLKVSLRIRYWTTNNNIFKALLWK